MEQLYLKYDNTSNTSYIIFNHARMYVPDVSRSVCVELAGETKNRREKERKGIEIKLEIQTTSLVV